MTTYRFEDKVPVVDPTAYIHPSAVLIGDVIISAGCYVGPNASLRGDFGRIILREGSNVQDNCVMHSFAGKDAIIEENGHIGHGVILHGCLIGRDVLIGMNAIIMDEAEIGEAAFVGAMSFIRAGFVVPPRTLAMGIPAKIIRPLEDKDINWKNQGTWQYHDLTRRSLAGLVECEPLSCVEAERPRYRATEAAFECRSKDDG
jgi:phenylacetic acid degradation protein